MATATNAQSSASESCLRPMTTPDPSEGPRRSLEDSDPAISPGTEGDLVMAPIVALAPFGARARAQKLSPENVLTSRMIPGPKSTMNIEGRMQKINGNRSFTGIF